MTDAEEKELRVALSVLRKLIRTTPLHDHEFTAILHAIVAITTRLPYTD